MGGPPANPAMIAVSLGNDKPPYIQLMSAIDATMYSFPNVCTGIAMKESEV